MKNTVIYLIGFAGVGKLTVAKELMKKIDARLIDNHVVANPIFSVGKRASDIFNEKRIEYVSKIRKIVLEAMVDLAEPEETFIMTNVLYRGEEDWYGPVLEMAKKKNAKFFPIFLSCSPEENKKRVQMPGRKENFKTIKESVVDEAIEMGIVEVDHPNKLEIDTTSLSPGKTAEIILEHIKKRT